MQTHAEIAAQCQLDHPVSTFHATGAPLKVSLHASHMSARTSHHDSHSPRPVCMGPPHGCRHLMDHLLHFTRHSSCPHAPHALPHTSLPSLVHCDPYDYFSLSSPPTLLVLQLHPFSPTPSRCQSPPPTWLPVSVGAHGRTKAGNVPQVCLHPTVSRCGPRSGSQAARRHACTRVAHR